MSRKPNGAHECGRCDAPLVGGLRGHGYCRTCKTEVERERRREHPEKMLDTDLRRLYRIDLTTYRAMWTRQAGLCLICWRPERIKGRSGRVRRLCVDHDALSGEVRGLLCCECNTSIGKFLHAPSLLLEAVKYLEAA